MKANMTFLNVEVMKTSVVLIITGMLKKELCNVILRDVSISFDKEQR